MASPLSRSSEKQVEMLNIRVAVCCEEMDFTFGLSFVGVSSSFVPVIYFLSKSRSHTVSQVLTFINMAHSITPSPTEMWMSKREMGVSSFSLYLGVNLNGNFDPCRKKYVLRMRKGNSLV